MSGSWIERNAVKLHYMVNNKLFANRVSLLVSVFWFTFLAGCDVSSSLITSATLNSSAVDATERETETVVPVFVQTAQDSTVEAVLSAEATSEPLEVFEESSPTAPCDLAAAGVPLDLTYPDDSRLAPGEQFEKTWRIKNIGSCPWDANYRIEWFSGDFYPAEPVQILENTVAPGDSVDISVQMVSPQEPGVYTSYWILRNPEGELFGIGPEGRSPFWVRIQVVANATATFSPSITPTLVQASLSSGTLIVMDGSFVDLGLGRIAGEGDADVQITLAADLSWWLVPLDENRLLIISGGDAQNCQTGLTYTQDPVNLSSLTEDAHICYLSSAGYAGILSVTPNQADSGQTLLLVYDTWTDQ